MALTATLAAALVAPVAAHAATYAESGYLSTAPGGWATDSTAYNVGSYNTVTFRADTLPILSGGGTSLTAKLKNANTGVIFSGSFTFTYPSANYEQIASGTQYAYGKLYMGPGGSAYFDNRHWVGRIGNVA